MHGQIKTYALIGPTEQCRGEDQVGGAGDREEFGQSLEKAKEKGLENVHCVDSVRFGASEMSARY